MSVSRDPLRAVIVDDEPLARRTLRSFLSRHEDVAIAAECGNGREAIAAIRTHRPDLVFLDIQMPGVTGFDVITEIGPSAMPFVIFVTAYDTHMLAAFDVHAVDYLLKPFSDARFEAALAQARTRIRERSAAELAATLASLVSPPARAAGAEPLQRFTVPADGRILFVRASDVDWIEAEDYYVCLHSGGARHLIRETMSALENQVDPGAVRARAPFRDDQRGSRDGAAPAVQGRVHGAAPRRHRDPRQPRPPRGARSGAAASRMIKRPNYFVVFVFFVIFVRSVTRRWSSITDRGPAP